MFKDIIDTAIIMVFATFCICLIIGTIGEALATFANATCPPQITKLDGSIPNSNN